LQDDLSRQAIAALASFLVCEARLQQSALRLDCGETFVPEDNGELNQLCQPLAEATRFESLLAFASVEVDRKADYQKANAFFADQSLEIALVGIAVLTPVRCQRGSDLSVGITDGQADPPLAGIDSKKPDGGH
jgi:hypothetical protein